MFCNNLIYCLSYTYILVHACSKLYYNALGVTLMHTWLVCTKWLTHTRGMSDSRSVLHLSIALGSFCQHGVDGAGVHYFSHNALSHFCKVFKLCAGNL